MRFQPYYQYLTGLGDREWNALTPEQHRELIRASKQKSVKPVTVEAADEPEVLTERLSFPVRVVSKIELDRMPVFELFL